MVASTTGSVGLDVHARSIRLAAIRADGARGADAGLRRGGGRAASAPLACAALLLAGGPDGFRSLALAEVPLRRVSREAELRADRTYKPRTDFRVPRWATRSRL